MRPGARVPRVGVPLLAVWLLLGCTAKERIPVVAASVDVEVSATTVEFGRGFPLTVVRVWEADRVPAPWSDQALAPLVLREDGVERTTDGVRIREVRRFRAHAFTPGTVRIPGVALAVHDASGTVVRTVTGAPIDLVVRSSLDPARPGPPEPPAGPVRAPRPGGAAGLAVLIALAVGASAWLVRRGRSVGASADDGPPRPSDPRSPAARRLRAELDALAGDPRREDADPGPFHDALSRMMRDGLAAAAAVDVTGRTTEELGAEDGPLAGLGAAVVADAVAVLASCDAVRFGCRPAGAEVRGAALAAARGVADHLAPPEVAS